ncbi:hypothetical protein FSARC_3421 [Fusarium sarcochroum]|uniref:Uncharacterized protein n=1 Tax=Fusarium sarcochroum TaxID=1208366 RepID=A0A8H4XCN3_9HYPO|nr:hypothetical protein FSARC_3421 [Fusarium sarcochroum]
MKPFTSILCMALASTSLAAPTEDAASLNKLTAREACSDGQCVTYFSQPGCSGKLGNFKPDCTGACFQFSSFSSVRSAGTGIPIAGTACKIYSDANCQNQIFDIADHIPVQCDSFGSAQSMQCFYNC